MFCSHQGLFIVNYIYNIKVGSSTIAPIPSFLFLLLHSLLLAIRHVDADSPRQLLQIVVGLVDQSVFDFLPQSIKYLFDLLVFFCTHLQVS